ncbi:MAG: RIP metalloprotease RseP [Bacteroidales bacterium]|jgi:regulator of sigma E protease|nr:RIP metalloprotease RseP [Bacteroidales bacterium]
MLQTIQLILSLSILVLIHELGHFTFAKLFKARVEKFYLFFNPWFSLFKYKKGDTTYGIGWLPFGGYCKISGMIDESLDKAHKSEEPKEWEYRSKTLGQRFLIISGGVIFNFILAFIIYSGVLYVWGEKYLPIENVEYGIYCDSLALEAGLQDGDKILRVDDEKPERLGEVMSKIVIDKAQKITVLRDGSEVTVTMPNDIQAQLLRQKKPFFISEFIPFYIDSIIPESPAKKAGLRRNDRIIGIDTLETPSFMDFVINSSKFAEIPTHIVVIRNGYTDTIPITLSQDGTLGVYRKSLEQLFTFEQREYSFFESIPAGISMGFSNLWFYVKQLKLIFTKEGSQQLGSFVSMGKLYDPSWNWQWFWTLTALFSLIIGFMNLLPIPGLDGGHLMFLFYELFTGKKPSDDFLERAQKIGMIIILALFLYAIVLDFGRLL